ncbi:MAG: PilT/PilU family type 4a pilus ATPase [Candidatus Thiodiazotropha lotti]|uniref:Type IV pili twitching motility protein PilT n=1 Tax=Candidatus Thiodiazotropha endoloripes TaxID=1818881 RepID=A0A1E2UL30_9GAMM|nr:PilT/PilU family type 4a pilus ATPase [Candidatus Thiodiazotropha endoloripes]MCG7899377.1 PilT/PilU family type 4a pilus ATPase [Candidatus Thiodiazotropha weberae]MCG7987391.1 PilT/PilU family type 4a pilus ATPase [Candidatus Thiodiazotropha lotti]MCG7904453.1 PilT/PilU family type 4a pilus ATPase [Candidatus Thiodiazotropha weberae]MCG7915901.1 PilT/PilU family type 4a pilus ATPase [Candidatus Thiodiazotropha weberae]MCG7992065.1 PilT/PilU family type 4a pilus ATPase [Candidatus Thiodiaz
MELNTLLAMMVKNKASDLFITAGREPSIKVDGKIHPVNKTALTAQQTKTLTYSIMTDAQQKEFDETHECNFAISAKKVGRFRVSAFVQRDAVGMVLRRIETNIPSLESLYLPSILQDLSMAKRGLVIFVGATGTGKSTSLAAMIGYRNNRGDGHIVSIEDPIEFMHDHNQCIITQREVGIDTESYQVALKNTLRQAPDVILIGEIRTRETMEHAIAFAETGHLCLSTLHANNANQALDRIIHFFPEDHREQIFMDLSLNLKSIVAQQLIPKADGSGRRAAIEVLLNTPLASELIRKGEIHKLKELMKRSNELGMITFDQHLYRLYEEGVISYENALAHADSANDVRLMIKLGASQTSDSLVDGLNGITLMDGKS